MSQRIFRVAIVPVFLACSAIFGGNVPLRAADAPAVPKLVKESFTYRAIVKDILPAVVSIESYAKAPRVLKPMFDRSGAPGVPDDLRRFFDTDPSRGARRLEPPREARLGSGSGFIIDAAGVIVTNNHVVDGSDQVKVRLKDGRIFVSKDIKTDPKTDLAIVRINAKEALPFLRWGNSASMEIGDRVLAVGAPFGLHGTVTDGIVSGKGRSIQLNMYEDFIQTDAAINPGNSGGPLISLDGAVIGVNSVIESHSGGFQGVGLAISSNLARHVVDQLTTAGVVKRGYIGVQIRALTPEIAERMGLNGNQGVLVSQVVKAAPAAKGGVREGDVITALDGKPTAVPMDLSFEVASMATGKTAQLTLWRDGKSLVLPVTIAPQPAQFVPDLPADAAIPHERTRIEGLGLAIADLTKSSAEQFGIAEIMDGALIVEVSPDGLAASAGLTAGSVIMKVNGKNVTSAQSFKDAVAAGSLQKGILMQVRSPTEGVAMVLLREPGD